MTKASMLFALMLKELRALTRDIHGLLVLFLMPAAFILIMSLALRDSFRAPEFSDYAWVVVDEDKSAESAQVSALLLDERAPTTLATRAQAEQALRTGTAAFALIIPRDWHNGHSRSGKDHTPLQLRAESSLPLPLLMAAQAEMSKNFMLWRTQRMLAGNPFLRNAGVTSAALLQGFEQENIQAELLVTDQSLPALTATQQSVPAWLTFAIFFVVIPIANVFIAEREQGTLMRLRVMQVPVSMLLLGKFLPFYLLNLVQAALMLLVGRFVVPLLGGDALYFTADWWALWLMVSSVSVAAISFALLVAVVARSTEQATTIGGVSNILLAAIGGIMVPLQVMPAFMRKLADWSPMNWGLDGFHAAFLRQASAGELLGTVWPLWLLAGVLLLLASWRLQKQ